MPSIDISLTLHLVEGLSCLYYNFLGGEMKYSIDSWVFEKLPNVHFGIIVAKGIQNTETSEADSSILSKSEANLRASVDSDQIKLHPDIARYRDALQSVGINPNKFMNSVEAMSKRVVKGSDLPRINALVDLCNAIALDEMVSLGAHDLADIDEDLMVRMSKDGDCFLPFASDTFETVPAGELVFVSGEKVQTRQWLWRQSELGKITETSKNIFFQLVGFDDGHLENLKNAMRAVEQLLDQRFGGEYTTYILNASQREIEF